jgi:hypothetical protein
VRRIVRLVATSTTDAISASIREREHKYQYDRNHDDGDPLCSAMHPAIQPILAYADGSHTEGTDARV